MAREMPARWLDDLMVASADSVVLFPMPSERADKVVRLAAQEVFPRLS